MADDSSAPLDEHEDDKDEVETVSDEQTKDEASTVITPASSNWEENAKAAQAANKEKFGKLKDFFRGYGARKKWTLPLTVVALLILLLALPFTRYAVLGSFWSKQYEVVAIDSTTGKPVSDATVTLDKTSSETNAKGVFITKAKLGKHHITISKKYYKVYHADIFVGILKSPTPLQANIVATGRQVPITVRDKVSGKVLADVTITAGGTNAKTDKDGKATIVLPTASVTQKASLQLTGYNAASVEITVTDQAVSTNNFAMVATGKLYFLSNLSGKLDVVKTNLDGSDRQTILPGTGKEDPNNTALLATRDWKYLALLSNRDGTQSIYLINTSNDSVTNIDGGSSTASFTLVGWNNHVFVYQVARSNIQSWQSGAQALKSYDADAGKLYNLDQTTASGTDQSDWIGESIGGVYIVGDQIIYSMDWSAGFNDFSQIPGKSATLNSVATDGSNKKVIKSFTLDSGTQASDVSIQLRPYEQNGLYVYFPTGSQDTFYDFDNGQLTSDTKLTNQTFYSQTYDTYLLSPSGKQTFWSDVRDNKNSLFLGDSNGASPKQIATLSDYTPYGWYTDNYLLVSKGGSELYIMAADGSNASNPLKITDYYKPQLNFTGYGGGYGGL